MQGKPTIPLSLEKTLGLLRKCEAKDRCKPSPVRTNPNPEEFERGLTQQPLLCKGCGEEFGRVAKGAKSSSPCNMSQVRPLRCVLCWRRAVRSKPFALRALQAQQQHLCNQGILSLYNQPITVVRTNCALRALQPFCNPYIP